LPQGQSAPSGAKSLEKDELARYAVVPWPRSLERREGRFVWNAQTRIAPVGDDPGLRQVAASLGALVAPATGFAPLLDAAPGPNSVVLRLDPAMTEDEGYRLRVEGDGVEIVAKKPVGLFYGVMTLRQLLPPPIEASGPVAGVSWEIPAVEIEDAPRFAYRGLHLDVARHFFSVEFVKRTIDQMARFKLNTFHWHLTEDQGWRIEIKKYPRLTEIGSKRKETMIGHGNSRPRRYDGTPHGGYYTQDEVREVVQYAAERFVTVMPEIEMPGHSLAALAAYPELGCSSGPFEVATSWGVFDDILCPREETFTFMENVLAEVLELFPSRYIHIGGDEAPKARWKESDFVQRLKAEQNLSSEEDVQSYFIRRIDRFLTARGRVLVGWDEILEGGLSPNATVMSWRGTSGGIEAAREGHDVIMSPTSHLYFDFYQAAPDTEPLAIGGMIPLRKVYEFEPVPRELSDEQARHVIGAQANVWTEYMKTNDHVEYMIFPRLLALSEVVWSPSEARRYDSFLARAEPNVARLASRGVRVAKHAVK
jgi:hexosaminidase